MTQWLTVLIAFGVATGVVLVDAVVGCLVTWLLYDHLFPPGT